MTLRALALAFAVGSLGCDLEGVEGDERNDGFAESELVESEEFDDDGALETLTLEPPQTAEEAGKSVEGFDLTASSQPVASAGWIAAVSEETPPSTCDAGHSVIGMDCMGGHCDFVQPFCGTSGGTPGQRSWSTWFSEENTSWRICPGTEWITGIACRGSWCDDLSIECTDLGIAASSCSWSGYFGPGDPTYFAPTGELIAGIQCSGAYCEDLRYLHCSV